MVWSIGLELAVSACALGQSGRRPTMYLIDPPLGTIPSASRRPEMLRIGFVRVAAPYAGRVFIYRLDDVRYVSDPYHVFATDPGAMLGSRMPEWLERTGPFSNVVVPRSGPPAPYLIEVTLMIFTETSARACGPRRWRPCNSCSLIRLGLAPK